MGLSPRKLASKVRRRYGVMVNRPINLNDADNLRFIEIKEGKVLLLGVR